MYSTKNNDNHNKYPQTKLMYTNKNVMKSTRARKIIKDEYAKNLFTQFDQINLLWERSILQFIIL